MQQTQNKRNRCMSDSETSNKRVKVSETTGKQHFLQGPIETLDDVLQLIKRWDETTQKKTKSNLLYSRLSKLKPELQELNNLIGLHDLKKNIIDQIIYFLQDLHGNEMMHTVFYGAPGCGKTAVANILAKIYSKLGILSGGNVIHASRSDFIGKYLGHTAAKTKKLLESAVGNILFIDEAYSLGTQHMEDSDSFSKEAIDTLNQFLSENMNNFICIIAGYEKEIQEQFFNKNPGLERRFPWKFHITSYSSDDLYEIFVKQIKQNKWSFHWDADILKSAFRNHRTLFPGNGGDCLNLFSRCKIAHSRRIFTDHHSQRKVLLLIDFQNAIKSFKQSRTPVAVDKTPTLMYL